MKFQTLILAVNTKIICITQMCLEGTSQLAGSAFLKA